MNDAVPSTIYGPVRSWRLGRSLGVDVLCVDSICSFECVYCQLGKINRVTMERGIFVSTERILRDLANSAWEKADVITFSGSGEPTLAANLGEAIDAVREFTGKPIVVLTNATLLNDVSVRSEIGRADRIFCKLDAWSEEVLRRIDRPHPGISVASIVAGIRRLRSEFKGFLAIQTMILRRPQPEELNKLAEILISIRPDEVQINLPTRPVPDEYFVETRGNSVRYDPEFHQLKTISAEELEGIRLRLSELTRLPVIAR